MVANKIQRGSAEKYTKFWIEIPFTCADFRAKQVILNTGSKVNRQVAIAHIGIAESLFIDIQLCFNK